MAIRALLSLGLTALAVSAAQAQFTGISDDFESYSDDTALYSVWQPRNGIGDSEPVVGDDAVLTSDATTFPGIQGQAVDHLGGSVLQHTGLTPDNTILPTESESIILKSDIFISNSGNTRMSVGLRNRIASGNFLELGAYNTDEQSIDPVTGEAFTPDITTYAYRLTVFGLGGGLSSTPNWGYFPLDLALDAGANPNGVVNPVDIGSGWHTYTAIITPDTITLQLDLYRDGLDNGATITAGSDQPGVDSTVTLDLITTVGYDSLRIGGPSGVSSVNGVAFDNVCLTLGDESACEFASGDPADLNTDGFVDGLDLGILLGNFEMNATASGGELNGTDPVDGLDLGILLGAWNPPVELSATSVPEPGSASLLLMAGVVLLKFSARRELQRS